MSVIQAQLNDFVRIWNIREIRKSSTSPGVPEILFNAPSTVGFYKREYSVDDLNLRVAQDRTGIDQHPICKNDVFVRYMSYSYATLISTNWKFHVTKRTLLLFMLKFWKV